MQLFRLLCSLPSLHTSGYGWYVGRDVRWSLTEQRKNELFLLKSYGIANTGLGSYQIDSQIRLASFPGRSLLQFLITCCMQNGIDQVHPRFEMVMSPYKISIRDYHSN